MRGVWRREFEGSREVVFEGRMEGLVKRWKLTGEKTGLGG